jgi:hypothetical protein
LPRIKIKATINLQKFKFYQNTTVQIQIAFNTKPKKGGKKLKLKQKTEREKRREVLEADSWHKRYSYASFLD